MKPFGRYSGTILDFLGRFEGILVLLSGVERVDRGDWGTFGGKLARKDGMFVEEVY